MPDLRSNTEASDSCSIAFMGLSFGSMGEDSCGFCIMDVYSKCPEVVCMGSNMTMTHTVEVLLNIFSTHGLPRVLVSDN